MADRVLIAGYYGFGNLGDEALLFALLSKLRECLPAIEPLVLAQEPRKAAMEYGAGAINRWNLLRIWRELGRAKLFLLGGGGLIQDVTSLRSPLYYLGLLRLARMRGIPVFLVGQGIGPLRSRWLRRLAVRELKRAEYVMVRDGLSLKLLQEWGADCGQLFGGYDLGLSLRLEASATERRDLLAVSLREPSKRERERFIAEVAAALDEAHRRLGLRPAFFPLYPRQDLQLVEEIRQSMSTESLFIDPVGLRPPEALALLGQARLMVGMRLHALEFAFIAGVPFLALSYDPKVEEFARLVKRLTELDLPLLEGEEVTQERLLAGLDQLWENEAEYRARFEPAAAKLQQLADSKLEEACQRMAKALETQKAMRRIR